MKKHSFKEGDLVRIKPSHRDTVFIGIQDDVGVVVDADPWGAVGTLLHVHWAVRQTKMFMSGNYLCPLAKEEGHAP